MPKVHFITHDGTHHTVDVPAGTSLMRAAIDNGVPGIDGDCGGQCACATCHVYIRQGAEHLTPADEEEEDQLDDAWGLDADSRLSCCVKLKGPALVVELPRYTKNHARER